MYNCLVKRFLFLFLSVFFSVLIILIVPFAKTIKPYLPFASYFLGLEKPTSYLVLLGNDTEMRANGGFTGSYAKIILSPVIPTDLSAVAEVEGSPSTVIPAKAGIHQIFSSFKPSLDLTFQDIYVPNGQIAGLFVEPPEPIQQAFGHGTWELANADWEPDFPTSAKTLRWFMEKGKEINPDILVLLNLTTIKNILDVVGSFPVPEHNATITPSNLYLFLQGKAEINFFPGSTQKKDTLTAVGNALIKKIKTLSIPKKLQIISILYQDFQNQNLLVHSTNEDFQSFLVRHNLAGELKPEALDTYSLVETNLGANKANQFVTRQTTHIITRQSTPPPVIPTTVEGSPSTTVIPGLTRNPSDSTEIIHHQVQLSLNNSSPDPNPKPPFHYGGNYIAYLRFFIPATAKNITIKQSPPPATVIPGTPFSNIPEPNPEIIPKYGLTEVGFWHTTLAGGSSTVDLSYDLPHTSQEDYSLSILKQHGMVTSPQTLDIFGKKLATNLLFSFRY
ncbi:MAG: hypothetical protein UW68_C0052G0002 [Candidatus Collierbacteria bacterium GW2011_GWB1_44_6]|uniref:Uncharacterized protein n=1 Tax=Candidatus Collierbacteria bacterium GW2011_GWB1_44_6 TaxID=1618384 RepID=A0A0G1LSY5_9BACT|nr:MAG: hypothetical protein UW68_C0052G0002 [Candidatus Collierbacteria bacterium GW2011_GWB1_44_6]